MVTLRFTINRRSPKIEYKSSYLKISHRISLMSRILGGTNPYFEGHHTATVAILDSITSAIDSESGLSISLRKPFESGWFFRFLKVNKVFDQLMLPRLQPMHVPLTLPAPRHRACLLLSLLTYNHSFSASLVDGANDLAQSELMG
jgi:hypothetical protein